MQKNNRAYIEYWLHNVIFYSPLISDKFSEDKDREGARERGEREIERWRRREGGNGEGKGNGKL
jgi:hypothetical protein